MIHAFSALLDGKPHTLILGSIPGVASLNAVQYYAHPRNAFWPIMAQIIGFDPALAYPERCQALTDAGYALWDVLARCQRQGSLDSAIIRSSEHANPIPELISAYPTIQTIICNGGKARASLRRHCEAQLPKHLSIMQLPSTSPANARLSAGEKYRLWHDALRSV